METYKIIGGVHHTHTIYYILAYQHCLELLKQNKCAYIVKEFLPYKNLVEGKHTGYWLYSDNIILWQEGREAGKSFKHNYKLFD